MPHYNHHAIAWSKALLFALSERRETWLISTHRPIRSTITGGCNAH